MFNFKRLTYLILVISSLTLFQNCSNQGDASKHAETEEQAPKNPLFSLLNADESGFYFVNEVKETEKLNIFSYEYMYNGAGVAIGDINNDGLQDIFMGGNFFGGRLFLNKGNLKFKQISDSAGVFSGGFTTGITMADVNADGWIDIYLCKSVSNKAEERANVLLINNGNNTFTNKAKEFGLDDQGFSQQASFFDYDNDGDLDMYLINHRIDFQNALVLNYSTIRPDSSKQYTSDKLYRNDGNNKFTDVTKNSGITNSSFTLSISNGDVNNDGWKDIYVSCDYSDKDHLYINNKNGTFTDKINEQFFHISKNSMGTDMADINNDGLLDIMTLDMMAEDNYRQKQLKGQSPYDLFQLANANGLHYQVMRNCLQLNNGNGTFSDIGQLAGVSHTDWSWSPLIADFDNDGLKDLMITNGYYRDVTDMDYVKYVSNESVIEDGGINKTNKFKLLEKMKQTPTQNYIFKNNGNLTFANKNINWGFNKASFSNGAAYADLDNDGDLDLIINNFNEPSFLYENNSNKNNNNGFVNFRLKGKKNNPLGIGAKIWIFTDSSMQTQELNLNRGFLSSVEPTIHFGIGLNKVIHKIVVKWDNNKMQVLKKINANQTIQLSINDAIENFIDPLLQEKPFLNETPSVQLIDYIHKESDFNDFKVEPLLEQMYSNGNPCFTKGDINGDKEEDIFVGGSAGFSGSFYIQQSGKFKRISCIDIDADSKYEDTDCMLFDIDNDKDLDLYVASGSNEITDKNLLEHRIYINDGKGNFKRDQTRLPEIKINGMSVCPIDFDTDGDVDLFIGGGLIAASYPTTYASVLLQNNNGKFSNVSSKLPNNGNLGMVTCAATSKLDSKKASTSLIIAGHWMGIQILTYVDGRFIEQQGTNNLTQNTGWWNCITSADFDNDGDMDFVVGNRGLNSFYKASVNFPANLVYNDFDKNGSIDAIPCYYFNDKKLYPKHTMDELFAQLPIIRKKYNTYAAYSSATIHEIFPKDNFNDTKTLQVTNFATSYIENLGNGKFAIKALPNFSQLSVVTGVLAIDVNQDGFKDIITIGNQYAADVEMGRYDAAIGMVLLNNQKGEFNAVAAKNSGFKVIGNSRKIAAITIKNKPIIMVSKNNASFSTFSINY